jgi:Cu(I)/Ag(I) efflux system membrane fusion protein/cobalt-zinc-cadmium efflux system membrane fusion protein
MTPFVTRRRLISILAPVLAAIVAAGAVAYWGTHRSPHAGPAPMNTATGDTAPAGPSLQPIQLTPQRLQQIGVTTAVAERKNVSDDIRTTGNVEVDERRVSSVHLRFSGWIQQVYVDSTFAHVRKGQPLFTIYSPELVTTEQEYLLAKKNQRLLAASSVPGVSGGATSLLEAARQRLAQWNLPAREIAALDATGEPRQELEIDSPAAGYVTAWHALPQTYAQPQTQLYTIADLSRVWVYAAVLQNDIGRVHVGNPASVTVDSYPGRTFRGRVDAIWPQVDEATRTVKVRLAFANPGTTLMPGMFVTVALESPLGSQLVIPSAAVFHTGTRALVFVDHGGGYLEPREIRPGQAAGDQVVVLHGLNPGDRVVTSANFLIDSESQLQAALGSFTPPPPGAGAAAAMSAGAPPEAAIALTTDPSPAHKGNNTVRVTLTDASGQPVTGAQVTVTFFMPAMPAMGMAAMRAEEALKEIGTGRYEGTLVLGSGGTWQVTVVARRQQQIVARQQLTVSATGGR